MSLSRKLRELRDKLRFAVNQLRYGYRPDGKAVDFTFAALQHLVIAKMDGKLGDTQVITPFVHMLRTQCPQLQLTVIATPNVAPLYADVLGLHTVVVPLKADPAVVKQAVAADELLQTLPCDALLTTEPNFRARDLCLNKLLQPHYIIGIEERSQAVNLNLKQRNLGRHITQYFADLLTLGGIKEQTAAYLPLFTAEDKKWAQTQLPVGCFGIAPYGASRHRCLSAAFICQLTAFLAAHTTFKIALLFELKDELKAELEAVAPGRLVYKPLRTTASQYAALIACCHGMLSVDSAAVHLSNAARIPAFCLYSGLDPDGIKRWGPAPFAGECVSFLKSGQRIDELVFADIAPALFDFLQIRFNNNADWIKKE